MIGKPWHHEELTRRAALDSGWSEAAAKDAAFHADYVDSYLYNPLWWIAGGLSRVKVSLSTGPALAKLHFDDLFSVRHIRTMWRRYTSGAVAGLLWAAERGEVQAARNIVGTSLHPLQDFYSHSNWVDDPARRGVTWLATPAAQRHLLPLYTGMYEQPGSHGIKHHGKVAPECKVLAEWVPDSVMRIVCHSLSPLTKSGLCEQWRACEEGVAASPNTVLGVPLPDGFVHLAPPGIALDSRWGARIGAQVRGFPEADADALFDTAYELALVTSREWLALLDAAMTDVGEAAFWDRVSKGTADRGREDPFEKFNSFPYMFMTAGPYPPPAQEPQRDWYLRVRLRTDDDFGSGTDSDIVAHVQGRRFLLDYMPRKLPGLAYNDFESGDDQVHYLGPFPSLPQEIVLENQSADVVEVLTALGRTFVDAVRGAVNRVTEALLSLIGGHADLVGDAEKVWTPVDLAAVTETPVAFSLEMGRPNEGKYRVSGTIHRTRRFREGADIWSDYEVGLTELRCLEESRWDRGTTSDEPFVLALLVNQASDGLESYRSSPFGDVDKGETRRIDHRFATISVPEQFGHVTLALKILESDEEGAGRREQALRDFAERVDIDTIDERRGFITTLGAAIAADWKLGGIEVFAFQRAPAVTAMTMLNRGVNQWVRGGQRATFPLAVSNTRRVEVGVDRVPSVTERSPLELMTEPLYGWFSADGATASCRPPPTGPGTSAMSKRSTRTRGSRDTCTAPTCRCRLAWWR